MKKKKLIWRIPFLLILIIGTIIIIHDGVRQRDQFDRFWSKYPRQEGKKKAWEKWQKLDPDPVLFAKILSGLDAHIRSKQWRRGVIPHAATWLNGERWEDELTPPPSPDRGRVEEGGCEYV